jgi:hypothetical protein
MSKERRTIGEGTTVFERLSNRVWNAGVSISDSTLAMGRSLSGIPALLPSGL